MALTLPLSAQCVMCYPTAHAQNAAPVTPPAERLPGRFW